MKEPDFLEELHRIREAMLAEHNGSLQELIRSLQKRQKKRPRTVTPKRVARTRRSAPARASSTRAPDKG